MITIRNKLIIIGAAVTAIGLPLGALSLASAATPTTTTTVPRSVYRAEVLQDQETLLKTSKTGLQTAHKDKTTKQLITAAGYKTPGDYHKALRALVTKDLEAKGYNSTQIKATRLHAGYRHEVHAEKKKS
jgi:hypothetical protein